MIHTKFEVNDVVRHRKGELYIIVGIPQSNILLEKNAEPCYMYQKYMPFDYDFRLWIRGKSEMEDGRFKHEILH